MSIFVLNQDFSMSGESEKGSNEDYRVGKLPC